MTTLYLLRHGETVDNTAHILQGQTDGRLTATGIAQVEAAARAIAAISDDLRPERIISSDQGRCRHTAQIVASHLPLPITYDPLLRERDWGSLTGHPIAEAQALHGQFPPDVETTAQMSARTLQFMRWATATYPEARLLIVTHGLYARCLQATYRRLPIGDIARMANAECRRLDIDSALLPSTIKSEESGAAAN